MFFTKCVFTGLKIPTLNESELHIVTKIPTIIIIIIIAYHT